MFGKIWRWLKKLWQQLFTKAPQPSPPQKRQLRSDAEQESLFLQLLDMVAEGESRGNIKGFLIGNRIDEVELVAWLRRFGSKLLESPENHRELGRRMVQLGKVAGGELGDVAGEIGRELWGKDGLLKVDIDSSSLAITWLKRAQEFDPIHQYLTDSEEEMVKSLGCYEETLESLNQELGFNSYIDFITYSSNGYILSNFNCYPEAVESYNQALKIKPNSLFNLNNRGDSLNNLGRYEEALVSFLSVLKINPESHAAWTGLGIAFNGLEYYEQAITFFDHALKLTNNQYWNAWADRGWAIYNYFPSRGYQAAIENWDKGLQAIPKNEIEGFAVLHQFKGNLHYKHGKQQLKQQLNPYPYWLNAKNSYMAALKVLSGSETSILGGEFIHKAVNSRFQLRYLEILEKLANVCKLLNNEDDFKRYVDIGDTILEQWLLKSDLQERKKQLAKKFATFSQLRVVLLAQSSQPKEALLLAEKRKNLCLRWLRESRYVGMTEETPLQYSEIEQFLSPGMAAIYWHYSPAAITTFIIKHHHIQIHSVEITADNPAAVDQQLQKFEDWLKEWKEEYQLNRKDAKGAKEEEDTWRDKMADRLDELGKILDIEPILKKIGDEITHLILIPHRDLHLLPLHYLFREQGFTITYLPSLKVGIDLQTDTPSTPQKLLSIESPSGLEFAEIESQIIAQLYHNPTWIKSRKATKNTVIAALSNSADIFHFTGHGEHNLQQPLKSALELANQEMLTLQDIFQLNLKGYQLACLSACETGITSKQGIIDEYVGLVGGFLAKGVTHVISTLWQVGEIETALMMIKFHQLYKDNIPSALALQKTKTWLCTLTLADLIQWYQQESAKGEQYSGCWESLQGAITKAQQEAETKGMNHRPYAHPYHWAGFILSGNHLNCFGAGTRHN